MGHTDGECAWTRAAASEGVPFMIPNLSSKSFSDIAAASSSANSELLFQIYVNPDRSVVLDQLRACEEAGVKALCITVDSAVPGKRERDLRNKIKMQLGQAKLAKASASGTKTRKAGNYANRDASLNWSDLAWFLEQTTMKIVLKGVQTGEDAVAAAQAGCHGIILSNHGGRNLDTSRSGFEVLPEVMSALREANLEDTIEVFVDGGIRRGTDILKALALGAKAVGLGKPAVFSMSAYGEDGIVKMLQILKAELERGMRLVGASTLDALTPAMVNCDDLSKHTGVAPIPPSPYAMVAPLNNVRSPPLPRSKQDILAAIEALKVELSAVENGGGDGTGSTSQRHAMPECIGVMGQLVVAFATSLGKTVLATSLSGTLHRSAMFLILYLILHMFCNLSVFLGSEVLNSYGHAVSSNPVTKFLEAYLLLGAFAHAFVAMYFTWNKRKFLMKRPLANGKLVLTSVCITAFLVLHLNTFRFAADKHIDAVSGKADLYKLEVELFSDPKQVAFYLFSLGAMGIHLYVGWSKTVLKMDVSKELRGPFVRLGEYLIPLLFVGFSIPVLYLGAGLRVGGEDEGGEL
jgi:succinate dehydrogenase/fumarate reductase cytochrome b subunit (b558 family)